MPSKKITAFSARLAPLPLDNVDTDQIIPARFLTVTDKNGLAENLFIDLRYDENKKPRPEFFMNKPEFAGAGILVARANFGCGSSREHAPWALKGAGFKAVFAISFADIFKNNALKNGLLPIELPEGLINEMQNQIIKDPRQAAAVDLMDQTVGWLGRSYHFEINPFSKKCLIEGVDDIGYLLGYQDAIAQFEINHLNF